MTALAKYENGAAQQHHAPTHPGQLSREQIELLKRTICNGATDDELALFLQVCKSKGLDPFSGQIHAVKRWDSESKSMKMTYQTGIDGFRLIAERTGERDGEDPPEWCDDDGVWHDVWLKKEPPRAARVRVYRRGHGRPYVGIAAWDFYAQKKKDGSLLRNWNSGGSHMLAKCAEALALRKAFPAELSGIYAREEMAQADSEPRHTSPPAARYEAPTQTTGPTALDKLHACETFAEMEALKPELAKLTGDERAEALRVYKERAAEFEARGAA